MKFKALSWAARGGQKDFLLKHHGFDHYLGIPYSMVIAGNDQPAALYDLARDLAEGETAR